MTGFLIAGGIVLVVALLVAWDALRLRRASRRGPLGDSRLLSRRGQDELRRVYDDVHEQARASRERFS